MRKAVFAFTDPEKADGYVLRMLSAIAACAEDVTVVVSVPPEGGDAVPPEFAGRRVVRASGTLAELYAAGARAALGLAPGAPFDPAACPEETVFLSDGIFPFEGFEGIFAAAGGMRKFDAWSVSGRHDPESASIQSSNVYNFLLHACFLCLKPVAVAALLSAPALPGDPDAALTRLFSQAKLSLGLLWQTCGATDDDTLFDAANLLRRGFPLVRRELFTLPHAVAATRGAASGPAELLRFLQDRDAAYASLVLDHLLRVCDPFAFATALGARWLLRESPLPAGRNARFVYHVSGGTLPAGTLRRLEEIARVAETVFTVPDGEGEARLRQLLSASSVLADAAILVCNAPGVAAGLFAGTADLPARCRFVGFAHDAPPPGGTEPDRNSLDASVLPPAGQVAHILSLFEADPRLGLLLPPVPATGQLFNLPRQWKEELPLAQKIFALLGLPGIGGTDQSCFSADLAFWCRPEALGRIRGFRWTPDAFPPSVEEMDRVLAHAMSAVAKRNGFHAGVVYARQAAENALCDLSYLENETLAALNAGNPGDLATCEACVGRAATLLDPAPESLDSLREAVRRRKADLATLRSSPCFDRKYYLARHPEAARSGLSPEEHYLLFGWKAGFDPSERFSTDGYLALHPGAKAAGACPLLHYERNGRRRGKKIALDLGGYRALAKQRAKARAKGLARHRDLAEKNKNARILVILHLFYPSAWKEIKEYLANLAPYRWDLVVTHTDAIEDPDVLADVKAFKPDATVRRFPNLGYDVGAFTEILSETDLSAYDIVFKLQSKGVNRPRIFIYGQYMERRDWFLNLFEGCLGADNVHVTVDRLLNDPAVGLVAASNLIVEDPPHKWNMVRAFMEEKGIPLPPGKPLFVAGTCFAAKACALQSIADMHLTIGQYQSAGRGFTLAHKMERVVCYAVLSAGFRFAGNDVLRLRRAWRALHPRAFLMRRCTGVRLLRDPRFRLDDEFVFFSLEHRNVWKYELADVRLGDIRRIWRRTVIPLSECMPYKYLVTGDPAVYEEYARQNKRYYRLDIMSRERFDALVRSMDGKGFDREHPVVLDGRNVILDGQHRCCYMLWKHGDDFKIPCVRVVEASRAGLKRWFAASLRSLLPRKLRTLPRRAHG